METGEGFKLVECCHAVERFSVELKRMRCGVAACGAAACFFHVLGVRRAVCAEEKLWIAARGRLQQRQAMLLPLREILLDSIEMTDWRMVVESFPDGRQTFPRLSGPPRAPRQGPGLVVTTLQYTHAYRGELVVNDYGSDWFMVAPNVDVTVSKAGQYRGQMRPYGKSKLFPCY